MNSFCHKSIGGFAVGKFSLQIVWYVCTCLPRGNQVDGLPRAASFALRDAELDCRLKRNGFLFRMPFQFRGRHEGFVSTVDVKFVLRRFRACHGCFVHTEKVSRTTSSCRAYCAGLGAAT